MLTISHLLKYKLTPRINISYSLGFLTAYFIMQQITTGIILTLRMNLIHPFDCYYRLKTLIITSHNYAYLHLIHMAGVTWVFIFMYIHIVKNLAINSCRVMVWNIGIIILILTMGTACMGYCLFGGQLSIWSLIVIVRMIAALPHEADIFILFLYNRRFLALHMLPRILFLHYLLSMLVILFIFIHIALLHLVGSTGRLGIKTRTDNIPMLRFVLIKDMFALSIAMIFFIISIYLQPYLYTTKYKYMKWIPTKTPDIVPEWLLTPYYFILKIIPHKIGGLLLALTLILILIRYNADDDYKKLEQTNSNILLKRGAYIGLHCISLTVMAQASTCGMFGLQVKFYKLTGSLLIASLIYVALLLDTNSRVEYKLK